MLEDKTPSASPIPARTPRRFNVMESSLCFVRNTRQENEGAYYNDGKKGRSSLILSKAKLIEAQKIHSLDESSHFCYSFGDGNKWPCTCILSQMYFITSHVTTNLYIFYFSKGKKVTTAKMEE